MTYLGPDPVAEKGILKDYRIRVPTTRHRSSRPEDRAFGLPENVVLYGKRSCGISEYQ